MTNLSLNASATRESRAGYTIGALVRESDGCDDGALGSEGLRSVEDDGGPAEGNDEDDLVRCGMESWSEYVESTDS
jgi:hypothetical protein